MFNPKKSLKLQQPTKEILDKLPLFLPFPKYPILQEIAKFLNIKKANHVIFVKKLISLKSQMNRLIINEMAKPIRKPNTYMQA
jgi:hypothetical protein